MIFNTKYEKSLIDLKSKLKINIGSESLMRKKISALGMKYM